MVRVRELGRGPAWAPAPLPEASASSLGRTGKTGAIGLVEIREIRHDAAAPMARIRSASLRITPRDPARPRSIATP